MNTPRRVSPPPALSSVFICSQVGENFVPPLLDAVLIDYQRNVPAAREPEVLSTMATIVNKLGGHITGEIPQIFDAVFECTLNMINKVSRHAHQRDATQTAGSELCADGPGGGAAAGSNFLSPPPLCWPPKSSRTEC